MSGITAVYQFGKRVEPDLLLRMTAMLAHRGPDAQDLWTQGEVGLAACLLRTTPESLNEQGVTSDERGNCRMVWDGRIDNREELIADLEKGEAFADSPDPALVLEAYRQWGVNCLTKILGDFAFSLWDEPKKTLFSARDRMGIKPFHYTWDGRNFYMSSEAKPLFEALGKLPPPEDEMILGFLAYRNFTEEDQGRTFFQGIHRLPPAHFLLLLEGRLEIKRYWSIDPTRITRYSKEEDYVEQFSLVFKEAVRCRLRANGTIVSWLSGGLDSSAVTLEAAEILIEKNKDLSHLRALNLFSDDPLSDERRYAREVASQTGICLYELFTHSSDALKGLDEFLWKSEAPMVTTSRNCESYEFLRDQGFRVNLTGEGGDHVLDEFGFPADLLSRMKLFQFIRKTRRFARQFSAPVDFFVRETLADVLPHPFLSLRRRLLKNVPPPWINASLARKVNLEERFFKPRKRLPFHSFVQASSYRNVTNPYSLLKWEHEERTYGLHGLEIRYPFLDSRLFEFILALPWKVRSTGVRKSILKRAMRGTFPDRIFSRRDKGDWTSGMDKVLIDLCRKNSPKSLSNRSGLMERYVNLGEVRSIVNRYLKGEYDLRCEVWFLITMDHWLKQFSEGGFRERKEARRQEKVPHPLPA